MTLAPGTRLGPYEILAPLGAGGMGEVYRARDARLGRDLAIKILPSTLSQDPDRVARFRREAQVLAAFNHPNIAAIYGLEESGGVVALALELVDGEDLAERLKRGTIPVDEAMAIARQIAEGLEAAHEKGIVHRDLKPANVKLTRDGAVKVLDFGLAKAIAGEGSPGSDGALTHSPTVSPHMTAAGMIMGTAAYMSPEQARGRPVDKRSDIWSFGVVLLEMLTGKCLFAGETASDVIASVLRTDPDWKSLPDGLPARVRQLLRRCLERDPRRRMRDIGEARIILEQPDDGTADAAAGPGTAASGRHWLPWTIALAGMALAAAMAALWMKAPGTAPRPQLALLELALPPGAELYTGLGGRPLALSPDGSTLAFVTAESGARRVHLRRLDSAESRVLPGGVTPLGVFFSHDGSYVGVIATDRAIHQVSVRDGAVTQRVRNVGYPGAAFAPDGRIVFVRDEALWVGPAGEGEPTSLTTLDASKDERGHRWPIVLPSGDTALFTVMSGADRTVRIDAVRLSSGERFTVEANASLPQYVAPGYLLFARNNVVLAAPFDAQAVKVTGEAVRVLENVSQYGMGVPVVAAAAESGHLVYLPHGAVLRTMVWVSPDGTEEPLPLPPDSYVNPRVSPDGRRIAVAASGGIWIADPHRETLTRLTPSGDFPVWSPDGKTIFYRNDIAMYRIASDGTGAPELLGSEAMNEYPSAVSPDGTLLASVRVASNTGADLHVRPVDGSGESRQLLATVAYEGAPAFSPDGRWLIYTSDETGRMEVYLRPFPGPERRWQISNDGGTHPLWDPGGRHIYYRHESRMMVVDVRIDGPEPELARPRLRFDKEYLFGGNLTIPNYHLAADGSRLLMLKKERSTSHLGVKLNWPEMMRAR